MNDKPPGENPAPPAAPAAPAAPATVPPKSPPVNYGAPKYVWPGAIVLAILIYLGLAYLVDTFTHESTDDAFIAGHVVSIAPRVAGQVVAVHVLDNQLVHSNDLLLELDPADFAVTVGQKQAAAVSEDANFRTVVAAYELMRAKVTTAETSARKARADVDSAAATATRAGLDFARGQDLVKQNTISQQEFDTDQAAQTKAQADLKSAQENADEEDSKVNEARKQLGAVLAQKDAALAQVSEAQTNIVAASLNLSYTKIVAPCDGRVTRKAVETGDYLQAAQQVMSVVPDEVWIVANFKESQLEKMRTNQPVLVQIDALGGHTFRAHVESVQAGSGAAFSLLPPENATGNFVKVIQRVPVKIVFDEPLPFDHVIGPGLSVAPSVQVSSFVISAWLIALAAIVIAVIAALIFMAVAGSKSGE
ncbi:MAG TPA: HlyD family secretion protein [Verrucomicrobiae bacterium]|nr:HlyD family secretion protein [Verrucomicrobiae bacterium]